MSKIEWTDKTWNPIIGCSKISEGCQNCYAEKMAFRLAHMPHTDYYSFVLDDNKEEDTEKFKYIPEWNGKTHLVESAFKKPYTWKKPQKIFVCSMGDLFHESVPFEWIDRVMEVIITNPRHTFQILTKRPARMLEYFERIAMRVPINAWLGVTVENQRMAYERIPFLNALSAKVKFVSIEPMLEEIDLDEALRHTLKYHAGGLKNCINWVIVGGESGVNARPIKLNWVQAIRRECAFGNTPFFFKQWGKHKKGSELYGQQFKEFPNV